MMQLQSEQEHVVQPAQANSFQSNRPWAVILAGGEGSRVRALTRELSGDDRPKQFCKLVGGETLLEQTKRRVGRLVTPERTVTVVTGDQTRFLDPETAGRVVAQPMNRGTAAAVLYSLLSIGSREPGARVALFPSDHYVANDTVFMKHVAHAYGAVRQRPDLTILLGIVPHGPETDYGWIQAGPPIQGVANGALYKVEQFWEKPPQVAAEQLLALGCLWNSLVVISSVRTLLDLMRRTVPGLCHAFDDALEVLGSSAVDELANAIYSQIPMSDFSRDVLSGSPRSLTVMPVANSGWVDVGRPERVQALRAGGSVSVELRRHLG